jgi:hypothetical protein
MRYLAFVGSLGLDKHSPAGWNDAFGGGDELEQLAQEASKAAGELLNSFTSPDVRFYVKTWWHVVDLDTGTIVRNGGWGRPECTTMSPDGWLKQHRK